MIDVQLVVTGKMELALGNALQAFCERSAWPVLFRPSMEVTSITSARLPATPTPLVRGLAGRPMKSQARKLAADVTATILERNHPDFVFVLDDVELDNDNQIPVVLDHVRAAFDSALATATVAEIRKVRDRVSFHLARPMIEAWLFPDPAALATAQASGKNLWDSTSDAERFAVTDSAYMEWFEANQPRSPLNPQQHPKWYLKFLSDQRYSEARDGALALAGLDWTLVPQTPPHMGYLHALLDDLGRACGQTYLPQVPAWVETRADRHAKLSLRNV